MATRQPSSKETKAYTSAVASNKSLDGRCGRLGLGLLHVSCVPIQLTSITGATAEAERADAVFPVLAADGSRHAISIRGRNIAATRATDNILSLAVLLKAGYKVNFRVGTDLDTSDGDDLYTPKGKRIALVFSGNLWMLTMWSSPSRCGSTAGIPLHQNPFAALLNIPENVACTRADTCACAMIETGTRHTILI